jgi:predicted Rossmann fold flavoprotein
MQQRLVVIGGGAGGFFCAVNAARMNPSLRVTILEKSSKLLSKVKVSGGGRCNVTHALFDITAMSKRYPRGQNFVKKSLHQFFTTDTIQWFESRGVKLKAEKDGRMFPVTDSSQSVIDCLMQEANMYGVDIRMNAEVRQLQGDKGQFAITLAMSKQWVPIMFVLLPVVIPKLLCSSGCITLVIIFRSPVPSLFTFNLPGHPVTTLMGVSVDLARVKIAGSKLVEEGPVLITHWGLSGPAILRLSAWGARELMTKQYDFRIQINWLPEHNEQTLKEVFANLRREHASKKVSNHNLSLPNRLWQFLLQQAMVREDLRFADLPAKTENTLIRNLVDFVADVKGKTTFKEEFVTAGGVDLAEVDVNSMMSKKVPNLFFAGEVLDVDGITGGFNFQHAWTSGWIAAKSISQIAEML